MIAASRICLLTLTVVFIAGCASIDFEYPKADSRALVEERLQVAGIDSDPLESLASLDTLHAHAVDRTLLVVLSAPLGELDAGHSCAVIASRLPLVPILLVESMFGCLLCCVCNRIWLQPVE